MIAAETQNADAADPRHAADHVTAITNGPTAAPIHETGTGTHAGQTTTDGLALIKYVLPPLLPSPAYFLSPTSDSSSKILQKFVKF